MCLFSINTFHINLLISVLINSVSEINEIHGSFCIIVVISPQLFFWLMSPHFSKIDLKIHSSSRNTLHKLPSLLFDKLYQ